MRAHLDDPRQQAMYAVVHGGIDQVCDTISIYICIFVFLSIYIYIYISIYIFVTVAARALGRPAPAGNVRCGALED